MAETKTTLIERIDRNTQAMLATLREIRLGVTGLVELGHEIQTLAHQTKDGITMANQAIAELTEQFNQATNAIADRIDRLLALASDQVGPEQLTELRAIREHLVALGADPANPVPPPA